MKKKERYNSLNGLRAISCIGILIMHVLANGTYNLAPAVKTIIDSLTQLVFLFMIISSFSMCCGYYEKIKDNKITLEEYYTKRIKKIMPFFIFLVLIDILYNHNLSSLIEGFANTTMMFGFLPKELSVIGVGWFLGLIFIFYMIFPFFVYLFSNKKRAWLTTIIAFAMNLAAVGYFEIGRTNMFYSFIYFCVGGLIYLYKDQIIQFIKNKRIISLLSIIVLLIMFYIIPINKYFINSAFILIFSLITCYAIAVDSKILDNKITSYISDISLEIYLSHMLIFRLIEKIKLTNIFNNDYISYIITCCICLIGTIVLAKLYHYGKEKIEIFFSKYKKSGELK